MTVIASGVIVWLALSLPADVLRTGLPGFISLPYGVPVLLALALVAPRRVRHVAALVLGVVLAVLVVLKALNGGFLAALDRPFDVLHGWGLLTPALGVLADSRGIAIAVLAVIGACLAVILLLVMLPVALRAVSDGVARHRRRATVVLVALAVLALVAGATGATGWAGMPLVSHATGTQARVAATQVREHGADRARFARAIAHDAYAEKPPRSLLAGLRGKDVLVVFVESYGKVALTDPTIAPTVDKALADATARLKQHGMTARSAFITSPTFGGVSWLAHSTVQSGLWVDSPQRYDQLLHSDRRTLTSTFSAAGWHTVAYIPEMTTSWPKGRSFYDFDQLLTGADVGYHGPRYGYALMPDEFIYHAFAERELGPGHAPVMAEIDTLSSHTPWRTPPRMVPWGAVGNGSIFNGPAGKSAPVAPNVKVAYARTVAYAIHALARFATAVDDPNLVILAMGDHQPHTDVSGYHADHNTPIMLITGDADVLRRTADWGFTAGLHPGANAPTWRMDQVRNRIFTTFGTGSLSEK